MSGLYKYLLAGGSGVVAFLLWGCSLESPKVPNWDTTVNIPVMDHRYTLADLIAEEDNFVAGADSLLTFHFSEALDTTQVGAYLTLPDFHESLTLGLDAFTIPSVPVMAERYLWSQLTSEAVSLTGTTAAIAPFSFNYVPAAVHSSEDLLYASLIRGSARLHLYNRLNVDLENLILTLQNSVTGSLVVSSPLIRRIAAGDSSAVMLDMGGCTIPREARWLISGDSPGSRGRLITVSADLPVDLVVELTQFVVAAAEARIPATTLERSETMALADAAGNAIDEAVFESGRLRLEIDNRSPFSSPALTLEFPQITVPATHKALTLTLGLNPGLVTRTEVDLAGLTADFALPAVGSPQQIQMTIRATTDDMRSGFVEIGVATQIRFALSLEGVRVGRFSGRLAPRAVGLDSTVRALDVAGAWGDLEGITLREARLQVTVYSTLNLPLRFRGALHGFRNGSAGVPFPLEFAVPAATPTGRLYTPPPWTANNSAIVAFINQQPDRIAVTGTVDIGDSLVYGSVRSGDVIAARFDLELPCNLVWESRQIDGDPNALYISPADAGGDAFWDEKGTVTLSGEAMERLRAGELEVEVENHLPVAGEVRFYFASDSSRLFTTPDLVFGPVRLVAAAIDAAGRVTTAATATSRIALDPADVPLFQNATASTKTLYFAHRVQLAGSNGRSVRLFLDNYVRVKALLQLTLHIGD